MCVYESEIHHRLFPPLYLLRLLNFHPPPQVDYVLGDNPRRAAALGFCKRCRRRRRERNLRKEKRFLWLHLRRLRRVTYGVYVSAQRSEEEARRCKP
ncbi:unnamed protein product [Lactuca virosa]|uniref:Uncharacterized protein n=1 Tax=Lactuca virosa TaxID=75947 RepID=A0AAU9PS39_9ASTR|nr:unnamed protein product [Lactuca virosa]